MELKKLQKGISDAMTELGNVTVLDESETVPEPKLLQELRQWVSTVTGGPVAYPEKNTKNLLGIYK